MPSANRRPSAPISGVGGALLVCAAALLASAVIDLTDGGSDALPLAATGLVAAGAGWWAWRRSVMPRRVHRRELVGTVLLVWLAMIAVSTLAYVATGTLTQLDLALFESTSGFTTTALSVIDQPDEFGRGILMWRALSQWIGGFSSLLTVVLVLPFLGVGAATSTQVSAGMRATEVLSPRVRQEARRLLKVYIALSSTGVALFLVGGMGWFDAFSYAFTTISTGGFANHPDSFGFFDSAPLEWFAIGGMLLAGANFTLLWASIRPAWRTLAGSVELRSYVGIVIGATVIIAVANSPGLPGAAELRTSAFASVSIASTTGHFTDDWSLWTAGANVILLILMGVGSMSGSTGGGFRVLRLIALMGAVRRELRRELYPRSVAVVRAGSRQFDDSVVQRMISFEVLYVAVATAGAVVIGVHVDDLVTALSAAISALSTVGPALGDLGPGSSLVDQPVIVRLSLMALMFTGRLSFYPVLIAIAVGVSSAQQQLVARRRNRQSVR